MVEGNDHCKKRGWCELQIKEMREQVKGEPHFSSLSGWEKGFEGKLTVWYLANHGSRFSSC